MSCRGLVHADAVVLQRTQPRAGCRCTSWSTARWTAAGKGGREGTRPTTLPSARELRGPIARRRCGRRPAAPFDAGHAPRHPGPVARPEPASRVSGGPARSVPAAPAFAILSFFSFSRSLGALRARAGAIRGTTARAFQQPPPWGGRLSATSAVEQARAIRLHTWSAAHASSPLHARRGEPAEGTGTPAPPPSPGQ